MQTILGLFLRILFPSERRRSLADTVGRALVVLGIALWSLAYLSISVVELGENPGWLHGVHLVFHEAGHTLTAMVTDNAVAVSFMGSGLQVLFPLFVGGAFYFTNRDSLGAALGLCWAGHATLDVAPYIADARALELQLLGGGTGQEVEGHDWEFLLTEWNCLELDTTIGAMVALAGKATMVLALCWALVSVWHDRFLLPEA